MVNKLPLCSDIDWEVFDLWLDGTPEGICVTQLRYVLLYVLLYAGLARKKYLKPPT